MTNYARIIQSVAVDVSSTPSESFHPDIAAEFVEVPDKVDRGWVFSGGKWSAPAPPEPQKPVYPVVTPMTFKMFLTSAERIAIKRLVPTDEVIDDWWNIVNDPELTEVDLNLESARDALDYLITLGVLTADRKAEILAGVRK